MRANLPRTRENARAEVGGLGKCDSNQRAVSGRRGGRHRRWRAIALGAAIVIGAGAATAYHLANRTTARGLQPQSQPSLPRPSQPEPGIGILRQTTEAWQQASGYGAYSYLIAGLGLAGHVASQPGRSLVYFAGTDVNTRWDAGVPYAQARRRGWLLRDSAGGLLVNRNYPDNYVGDVGNPAYQHAWLDNVSRFLRHNGDDGVFIDDVIADLQQLAGTEAAKYPTSRSWAAAELSFIRTVGAGLRAKGYYVLVNASGYVPGNPASNDGSNTVSWWRQLAPHVSGLMNEYYQETPDGTNRLRSTGPAWTQNWDAWQRLIQVAQSRGRDFVGLTKGPPGDARLMSYGKASFLLDWNGRGGAFVYQPTGHEDPWNGAWTRNIGHPKAPARRVGVAWIRPYSHGLVLLNPSLSHVQHFSLRGRFVTSGRQIVTTVTLAPTTGLILRVAAR